MALEIERKFLVKHDLWNRFAKGAGSFYQQGYLLSDAEKTIRVRVGGEKGFITVKGRTTGIARAEYEYEIPKEDALALLQDFTSSVVTKYRYRVLHEGKLWEVDEFLGGNSGLILAEIELQSEDETFSLPPWAGAEVTGDKRYYNACLAQHPYQSWKKEP